MQRRESLVATVAVLVFAGCASHAPAATRTSEPPGPPWPAATAGRDRPSPDDYQRVGLLVQPVPSDSPAAKVSGADAERIAAEHLGLTGSASDLRHGLVKVAPYPAARTVWIVAFGGGHAGPGGPPGPGLSQRSPLLPTHSGAVIDDQTGRVLTAFQIGSQ